MKNREEIFAEAKKQGLILTGHYFIDYQHGMLINSAYLISKARRLMETMSLEESILRLIEEEGEKSNKTWSNSIS